MVSEILDIASFDSGRIELRSSAFSLDELLADECRRVLPLAQAKNLWLHDESTPLRISLQTDRAKLARIVGNLLANAIKFTENGGVTVRSAVMSEGGVHIGIGDTGIGIAAENLPVIFNEFARVGGAAVDHNKGWGLGLAICGRLVQALDGKITVTSELYRGSVFTVCLPSSCIVHRQDPPR